MGGKKRPVMPEDLYQMKWVGDVQISPDGTKALYTLTGVNEEKNGYYSSLWLTDFSGEGRPFTHPQPDKLIRDRSPRWSPDGRTIAFLSNRSGSQQIWLIPSEGGDARQLTAEKRDIISFVWSPDGSRIAFLLQDPRQEERDSDVKIIANLRYKHDWKGFRGHHLNHIWVVDVETGISRKVTDGDWEDIDPVWSPDGKSIIFISDRSETREIEHIPSLWKVDVESGACVQLVSGKGFMRAPSFSPDGRYIAYFDHEFGETSAANDAVWIVPSAGGEARKLTAELDLPAANYIIADVKGDEGEHFPVWSHDGQYIYFLVTNGGNCWIYRVHTESGQTEPAVCDDQLVVTSFALHDRGDCAKLVYVGANPLSSGDIYFKELDAQKKPVQLTDFNRSLYDQLDLSVPERIAFTGADDWQIEGWILKPPHFVPGKKYPLVLQIHGGPHATYGNAFFHEFQILASAGYVVLYTNPRGSHGYGLQFVRAVLGDWGGKDYIDLMKAVDYACTLDYVDEKQLFVTGGSYGGYMTNWIIGHTDRFKAAVTQRSISNLHSMFGTSDIGYYFLSYEFLGKDIWEDEAFFLERSPIRYAKHVKTPVLIEHSENDLRCPMEQAEQWYIALKRFGVETVLVRTPNEGHELSRSGQPKHRVERLYHILNWFNRFRSNE